MRKGSHKTEWHARCFGEALRTEAPHDIFDFFQTEKYSFVSDEEGLMEDLGGLLPEAQLMDNKATPIKSRIILRRGLYLLSPQVSKFKWYIRLQQRY